MSTAAKSKTVITIQGDILATGIGSQKASAVSRKHGDQPAGVYVVSGGIPAAKAAMAHLADRYPTLLLRTPATR